MAEAKRIAPRMAVVQAIKQWIADGELPLGAALPSERVLSAQLSVQRPTIRRAMRILEEEGVIQTRGPWTRVVAERKQAMAHSIVVAAMPQLARRRRGSPWGMVTFEAVLDAVNKRGYNLMLIHSGRSSERDIDRMISGSPSGVVVPEISPGAQEQLQWSKKLERSGIPMVVYGGGPELAKLDRVTSDHDHGAYELARWLLARGCRRILMFFEVPPDSYWVKARRTGYERAMAEAGVEPLPLVVARAVIPQTSVDPMEVFDEARRRAASYLLEYLGPVAGASRVDAIMTASDGETFAVASACRLLGVEPGKDVAIVGYDNYWREVWERTVEPAVPLATVDKHDAMIGCELVNLLVDRIEGRLPAAPQTRVVPPQLIVTETQS